MHQHPYLRLVTPSATVRAPVRRSSLTLASILPETPIAQSALMADLFNSLAPGESLEFTHTVCNVATAPVVSTADGGPPPRYGLRIAACSRQSDHPHFAARAFASLRAACGHMHLTDAGETALPALPFRWQASLAPLRAMLRPAPGVVSVRDESPWQLPHPANLPGWALSALLDEPLDLPGEVRLVLRIARFTLAEADCEKLARLAHRLQSGQVLLYEPRSRTADAAAARELLEPTLALMRQWMRHAAGWTLDCRLEASGELSRAALQRLAWDVVGQRPVHIQAGGRDHECGVTTGGLPSAGFTSAVLSAQGLPGLLPAPHLLPALGVPRHYAPPASFMPVAEGAPVGRTVCGAQSVPFAVPHHSRSRHVAIVGATGSGKSSLMLRLLAEDMASPARPGIGLIDPHGMLYAEVLRLIPRDRVDDVVLVDVTSEQATPCLNPLSGTRDPAHARFMADEIVSLVDALFEGRDTSGPATRGHLKNILLLAMSSPGRDATLMDVMRIIEDADFGDWLAGECADRKVAAAWRLFRNSNGEHGHKNWLPYLLPRLAPFVDSPVMKRLLSRPRSSFNVGEAMERGKILLFNFSKSVLGDTECRIAGSLVLARIFAASLARRPASGRALRPFHLFVDEFQSFATDSVPRLFAEARKFGLCLTTANQSLGQLLNRYGHSSIGQALLANTATKFLFRLGPSDIGVLSPYFAPAFSAPDMANLADGQAVVCAAAGGRPMPPFVARIDRPQPDSALHEAPWYVQALSDERYGCSLEHANGEIAALFDMQSESLAASEDPTSALADR